MPRNWKGRIARWTERKKGMVGGILEERNKGRQKTDIRKEVEK
jgi:hypothetical protein